MKVRRINRLALRAKHIQAVGEAPNRIPLPAADTAGSGILFEFLFSDW